MSDGWVLVRSSDELRVGLLVQIRPCGACGRIETFVISNPHHIDGGLLFYPDKGIEEVAGPELVFWKDQPMGCGAARLFKYAISEHRLYRLAEEPPAETVSESARSPARKPVTVR